MEDRLNERLLSIHKRLQRIADEEARSAWMKGVAASGAYAEEKVKLIDEAEKILDRLEEIFKVERQKDKGS